MKNNKYLKIKKLYEDTVKSICSNNEEFTRFFITAAHNYRYDFNNAVAAFAQKHEASALLTYDQWQLYGRVPKRYAKSILLFDNNMRNRYTVVFDYSSTVFDKRISNHKKFKIFDYNNTPEVISAIKQIYEADIKTDNLSDILYSAVYKRFKYKMPSADEKSIILYSQIVTNMLSSRFNDEVVYKDLPKPSVITERELINIFKITMDMFRYEFSNLASSLPNYVSAVGTESKVEEDSSDVALISEHISNEDNNYTTDTLKPEYNLTQADIEDVILSAGANEIAKYHIYDYFNGNKHSQLEKSIFLRKEYGDISGFDCTTSSAVNVSVSFSSDGMEIKGIDFNCSSNISYYKLSEFISDLIESNRFLSGSEILNYMQYVASQGKNFFDVTGTPSFAYSVGDAVDIGSTTYTISALNDDTITLSQASSPLFSNNYTIAEFENILLSNLYANKSIINFTDNKNVESRQSDFQFQVGEKVAYNSGNDGEHLWTVDRIDTDNNRIVLSRETGNIVMPQITVNTFLSEVSEYVKAHQTMQADIENSAESEAEELQPTQKNEALAGDDSKINKMIVNDVSVNTSAITITCEWSESFSFEDGKTYSVSEFDSIMRKADNAKIDGKKAAIEHYGSQNAWDNAELYGDKEEYFKFIGYDKVKFTINMPDGRTFTERQDIGDGDGGVIDFLSKYSKYDEIVPILRKAAETDVTTEVLDYGQSLPYTDAFYVNSDYETVTWMYYNSDSSAGGQFVTNQLIFAEILYGADNYTNANDFFDYLGSIANQTLADVGTEWFIEAERRFTETPDLIGCTDATMEKLIEVSKQKHIELSSTDIIKDYQKIQSKNPNIIVLYPVGDFYEVIGDNASYVADVCNLVLTYRTNGNEKTPMVGFPKFKLDDYKSILLQNGNSVRTLLNKKEEKKTSAYEDIIGKELEYGGRKFKVTSVSKFGQVTLDDISSLDKGLLPIVTSLPYDKVITLLNAQTAQNEKISENFIISNDRIGEGTPSQRYFNNVNAIKLLKTLLSEERAATPQEQEILSKYVGWGGLSECFDKQNSKRSELLNLLSSSEFSSAQSSTLTAFYTPPVVIKSIYKVLDNIGFTNGSILDPALGTGHFFGLIPEHMQASKLYGIEIDNISGSIAQKLYPKANITIQGFEDTSIPDNYIDVVVGNVPFGNTRVFDASYNKYHLQIHDYFFVKALDKVRPGGILAFVTSKGTLDKRNSDARKMIAEKAELLGAVRLPNNTFKKAANTEVTSDIIFLQKRLQPLRLTEYPDWVNVSVNSDGIELNNYFISHSEMICGHMEMATTRYGIDSVCIADDNISLSDRLSAAVSNIHGEYKPYAFEVDDTQEEAITANEAARNYSYFFDEETSNVYYRENGVMFRRDFKGVRAERVKGMIKIADAARTLINAQVNYCRMQEKNIRQ